MTDWLDPSERAALLVALRGIQEGTWLDGIRPYCGHAADAIEALAKRADECKGYAAEWMEACAIVQGRLDASLRQGRDLEARIAELEAQRIRRLEAEAVRWLEATQKSPQEAIDAGTWERCECEGSDE